MQLFLALLLLCTAYSEIIHIIDTQVVTTSRGGFYFDNDHRIYKIGELNGFEIQLGRASIKFEINERYSAGNVKILDYKKLEEIKIKEMNLRQNYKVPRTFDKKVNASIIRYNFKSGQCMSMEVAKFQLHHLNMQLKLMMGYRTEYDEVNSYITPTCIDIADSCWTSEYNSAACAFNEAARKDPPFKKRFFATTIHVFERHYRGWDGLAELLNDYRWAEGHMYWALVQRDTVPVLLEGFSTMVHEVGHNMGYHHASSTPVGTGFMRKYQTNDFYDDYSNYMGWGSNWYNIPGPGHWMRIMNQRSVFPPWVRQCENGVHKYRLFAWDYAYTRVFLGDDKRITHQENDIIDGIPFKYNTAGIIIEYGNNTFNTALSPLIHGSIAMEYHWFNGGLENFKNKGIKFTITDFDTGSANGGLYSMYLTSAVDDISDFTSSEIPLNYLKVPEVNIGTMKFRITKFHPIEDTEPNPELLNVFPTKEITLEDVPYVEVEMTHLPNVPYTKPTVLAPVPELVFSPSLSNCNYNSGLNVYNCQYFNENNYWTYVKPGASTNNTLPRFYTYNQWNGLITIPEGRLGVVSYPGESTEKHGIVSGTMDIENVRTTKIEIIRNAIAIPPNFYFQDCIVSRMNFTTSNYDRYVHPGLVADKYDILFIGKEIMNYKSYFVTDIYFNNLTYATSSITTANGGLLFFKGLPLQGFTKIFVKMLDVNGNVANQITITRQEKNSSNRVAVFNHNATEGTVSVEAATLKGKKTIPNIMGPIEVELDTWHFFPYNRLHLLESIYIDFKEEIPEGLVVEIMTEMGVFRKDLSYMAKFPGQTAKIIILEISQSTGGWGEVYQYKFNKNVTLMGMRYALRSEHLIIQPGSYTTEAGKIFTIIANVEKYSLTCGGAKENYEFQPFKVTLLDQELFFNSELNVLKVNLATPYSVKYQIKQTYNVLTDEILLVPTINPIIGTYSYTMKTEIEGLFMNELTGVITGYINNNLHKTIEVVAEGERSITYTFDLNIGYPKCAENGSIKGGDYNEIQNISCSDDMAGQITYKCIIENHQSVWKEQGNDCRGKIPTRFEYTIEQSYLVLTQSVRLIPVIEPDIYTYEYSFIKNTLPKGLSIDSEGIISGYIEDDSIKEINITVVGGKESTFTNPRCLSTDILDESDYSTEIEVSCNDDENVGLYKYKCSIDAVNHVSAWERSNHTCRAKYVHTVSYTNYTGVQGENVTLNPVISNPSEDNLEFYSSDLPYGLLLDKNTGVISGNTPFVFNKEIRVVSKGEREYIKATKMVIDKNKDFENKYCENSINYGSMVLKKCAKEKKGLLKNECSTVGEFKISDEKCYSTEKEVEEININLKLKPNKTLSQIEFNGIETELVKIFGYTERTTITLNENIINITIIMNNQDYINKTDPIIKIGFTLEVSNVQLHCYESNYEIKLTVETTKQANNTKMEGSTFIGIVTGSVGAVIILGLIVTVSLKYASKRSESRKMKNRSKHTNIKIDENEKAAVLEVPGNDINSDLKRNVKTPNDHTEAIRTNTRNTPQNTKLNRRNKNLNSCSVEEGKIGRKTGSKKNLEGISVSDANHQNLGTSTTPGMINQIVVGEKNIMTNNLQIEVGATATNQNMTRNSTVNHNSSIKKPSVPMNNENTGSIKISRSNSKSSSSSFVANQKITGESQEAESFSKRKISEMGEGSHRKAI